MDVKRVRFKDPASKGSHLPRHGSDASSLSSEMTEAPQSSKDPKTSEYAFFKKLKQSASSTSRRKPLESESTHLRKLKKGKNFQESGNVKHKEAKFSIYVENPAAVDADSFMFVKDAGQEEHAGLSNKAHDDHVMFKSSSLSSILRTPTMELDAFLATDGYSFTKPENQLKEGDIFSSKRLKLRQLVAKTLFPDTGEVPKECDVVSLLLSRLLPKESENIQYESPNMKLAETKATSHMLDEHIHVVDDWDTSMDAERGRFSCSRGSASWSRESNGRHHSSKSSGGINSSCGTRMLLGYRKMNERENCSDDIGSACWSDRFGDRNLLTWSNKDPRKSIGLPNNLADTNILAPSNDQDFLTACNKNTDVPELQMHQWGAYDGVSGNHSLKSWDKTFSYQFPTESYSSFSAIDAKRTDLERIDERFNSSLDKGATSSTDNWFYSTFHGSFRNHGSFESNYLREELNKLEIRREPSPLLLGWNTDQTYTSELSHTSHMELDTDPLPLAIHQSDDDLYSFDNYRIPKTGSSSYSYRNQYTQIQDIEDQIHVVARSRCSALTSSSYDLAQPEQMDGGFSENIFLNHNYLFLPQTHQLSAEKLKALLVREGAYSDPGLKCDQFTDNVLPPQRWDDRSLQFLENENDPMISRPENWSLMSVHNPVGHQDLFAPQIHKLGWIDSEVETYHGDRNNFI